VQQFGQIRVGEHRLRQVVAGLERRWLTPGAVKRVQFGQSRFGPDAEAADVTTGCQRAQVQFFHVQKGNAGNVAKCLADAVVAVVDDARARPHDAASIAHFTLSGAEPLGRADLLHVLPRLHLTQQSDGLFRLLKGLNLVVHDERNLGDLFDLVTF